MKGGAKEYSYVTKDTVVELWPSKPKQPKEAEHQLPGRMMLIWDIRQSQRAHQQFIQQHPSKEVTTCPEWPKPIFKL